ncbi:long-chain fatty acid--CoA ligase [Alteromonas aestuariivivens]|uniref:Long-chain fatty acid--CoA ligase n=1 Tax=Alteromonas aestuariivivens TaxID=1938339 RepID=A0A3D8MB70_9ALTE|nr:class I adenylate-forming enzyme family protein [Alteromonas aestuariivivens]RDV27498.1 long-chain fatty acid--CoA ligase [Alteromonas aestuariivivens]
MESIGYRFEKVAERRKDAVALVIDSVEYTYAQLLADVRIAKNCMLAQGLRENDCIANLYPNGYPFVVYSLATFALGGILLPVNNTYQPNELQYYLETAEVKGLCSPTGLPAAVDCASRHTIPWFDETALEQHSSFSSSSMSQSGGMYLFSSGSTGKSKRVFRTQQDLVCEYSMMSEVNGANEQDIVLCTLPLYHAHGFGNALLMALLSGAKCIVLTHEFNGRKTMQAIADYKVSLYPAVPFMFQIMALARFNPPLDFSSLRYCLSSGAPLSEKIFKDFHDRTGIYIGQIYGSSETGAMFINTHPCPESKKTVGFPLPGIDVEIRSDEGEVLLAGEEGEIWVRSPAMTKQYDGMPEATAAAFVDGWFFTGDMGVFSEFGLTVTGRKKLLINVAGNKVDPLEVETLINSHEQVEESVVVAKPHETYGEQVVAYVVLLPQSQASVEDLQHYVKGKLVEYKVPKQIIFLSAIPKSPLGKILRKYL